MKKTPVFHNVGSAHSYIVLFAGFIVIAAYPFWVWLPTREVCTLKWSMLAWGLAMIVGINGIKMNQVLNQVRFMPMDRPERLALVNSSKLILNTVKLSIPVLGLTASLYLSNPTSTYQRIPNMIWLKQDLCEYNWLGKSSLYAMLFYVFLQWSISVAATYQVFIWNKKSYYGDWLYVKESSFIALSIFFEGFMLIGAIYTHLWVTSYPTWCNEDLNPHIFLNQTCNIRHEEERGVYIHSITLIVMAALPAVINFTPKLVIISFCPKLNNSAQCYTRLKTPEEVLNDKVIELNDKIVSLEDDLITNQDQNDDIKEDFAHSFSSLRNQLQLTKTALAKSVPTVEKFLRSLRLGKYVHAMHANGLTVKRLIQLHGEIDEFDDPPINMKTGHLKKMQRGLYNVARVMDFNYKFIERRADLEREGRLEQDRQRIAKFEREEMVVLETVLEEGMEDYDETVPPLGEAYNENASWIASGDYVADDGYYDENGEWVGNGSYVMEGEVDAGVVEDGYYDENGEWVGNGSYVMEGEVVSVVE